MNGFFPRRKRILITYERVVTETTYIFVTQTLENYREIYLEVNGTSAPPPILAGWTYCDENPERAREMAKQHIGGYLHTVLEHYEFAKKLHTTSIRSIDIIKNDQYIPKVNILAKSP